MAGTFDFCPNSLVPEMLPPDPIQGVSFNGWNFSAKPGVPYQRKWKITLYGLRWLLNSDGSFDLASQPSINAARLEKFYQDNQTWDNFQWTHPHIGTLQCRFSAAVTIPAGEPNSNGLIAPFEINLIHHNPSF